VPAHEEHFDEAMKDSFNLGEGNPSTPCVASELQRGSRLNLRFSGVARDAKGKRQRSEPRPLQERELDGSQQLLEPRDLFSRNVDSYRTRSSGGTRYQSDTMERENHLVHDWWGDLEIALQVRFGWGTTVHFRVGINECQILALQVREGCHAIVTESPNDIAFSAERRVNALSHAARRLATTNQKDSLGTQLLFSVFAGALYHLWRGIRQEGEQAPFRVRSPITKRREQERRPHFVP
jgi:hypothetical protein